MGGEKRMYGKVDKGGRFTEVKPAEIYRSIDQKKEQGLGPLNLDSLAGDGDLEKTLITEIPPTKGPERVRSTNEVMGFSPEKSAQLRAERDAAILKYAAQNRDSSQSGSADQTVMYRRQPGGASEHQLPTEKTGIIDMKNDQGFKRAAKPAQPPAQPSRWQRLKGFFSKSI